MGGAPLAPSIPGYRDLTLLGRGGYSEVYRAHQEQFDRWVAVKLLTFPVSDEPTRQRFLSECRVAGRVSAHPNIVTVYDAGIVPDGRPYIAMELCDQGSVADRLRATGPFDVGEALGFAIAVAGALESAHRAGVVHRDVKPGNVMLTSYGQPALTDFGLSIVAEHQEVTTGVDALSPHYAPPEALEQRVATPGADVYSLTATTYAMLAGHPPHQRQGDEALDALVERILSSDVPPVPRPDVPASLQTVLHFGMARDPGLRAPSALAFAQALQQVQTELGTEPTQPVVLDPPAATPAATATAAAAATADELTVERELYAEQATPVDPVHAPVEQWAAAADPTASGFSPAMPPGDATMHRAGLPLQPPAAPTAPQSDEASGSRAAPLVVLLVVLILVAAGGLVYLLTSDDGDSATGGGSSTTSTEDEGDSTTTSNDEESTTSSRAEPTSTTTTAPTTTTTLGPEIALPITGVSASSTAPNSNDACGTATSFDPSNLADGVPQSAWRTQGDASGQTLTITLDGQRHITQVGLLPGYAKSDPCDGTDRWAENRRPTQVTWTFDDGTEVSQPLDDVAAHQTTAVDVTTSTIRLRIDGVTPLAGRDYTAISEVSARGR